jgi:autotransporter-associated beta strand protein
LAVSAILGTTIASGAAVAADSGDITSDILANRNVTLSGDAVVNLPSGTTTYTGGLSGEGTLTVGGTGTLILTKDSDFTLPRYRQRQRVNTTKGNHPYTTVSNPDPPAVIVKRGAILQYGNGEGQQGVIGHYPYRTPGYRQNADNIRVDGTLRLAVKNRSPNLGTISGSGLVTQPRFLWGGLDLTGPHPFSGVIDNGTGINFGRIDSPLSLPQARAILNQGSAILSASQRDLILKQNFYERHYGSDVNVHTWAGGKVVLAGVYSYTDHGPDTNPSLSDPSLNYRVVAHKDSKRGTNIEGANVQWGDGTTNKIFMPGTKDTVYINLHEQSGQRSRLAFDYNGPVTLSAPIGGGKYHDTLAAPGAGDIVLMGTRGNDVTFSADQYYDGSTTIEPHATLRLGSGHTAGDGSLLTGSHTRRIVDLGALVVDNTTKAIRLSHLSGGGSLTQSGAATTTLTGATTYTGKTTVSRGRLAVAAGNLSSSRSVELTGPSAILDLRMAGKQAIKRLTAVGGATILLATGGALTVGHDKKTVSALAKEAKATIGGTEFRIRPAGAGQGIALISTGNGTDKAHTKRAGEDATSKRLTGQVDKTRFAKTANSSMLLWSMPFAGAACAAVATVFCFIRFRRLGPGRDTVGKPQA